MPRIDKLLFSTDFDTIKNDGSATITVVIPGGDVFAAGETKTYVGTTVVGESDSLVLMSYLNDIDSNGFYRDLTTAFSQGRTAPSGDGYNIIIRGSHIGGGAFRMTLAIKNTYGVSLTIGAQETWTFKIRTLKVPRFS